MFCTTVSMLSSRLHLPWLGEVRTLRPASPLLGPDRPAPRCPSRTIRALCLLCLPIDLGNALHSPFSLSRTLCRLTEGVRELRLDLLLLRLPAALDSGGSYFFTFLLRFLHRWLSPFWPSAAPHPEQLETGLLLVAETISLTALLGFPIQSSRLGLLV